MARIAALAVVVLLCAGLGVIAAIFLRGESDLSASTPQAPQIDRDRDQAPAEVAIATTTTAPTIATTTTVPTCVDELGSAYWPTTTQGPIVSCPDNPFGTPERPLTPIGTGWIAVLESIPIFEVGDVDPRIAQLEAVLGRVELSDSRNYFGLRDPYWVLHAGPFSTRDEASVFCSSRPTLDPCYPRQL